ncbi:MULTISPECIES: TonB-dependent receptor [Pseudoalteromonas]|uniref:TonB-dependent receptor n=1 Tax=Pseudoalteromonas amylolytica TaxID=1859457 RepID=A0A1S1MV46_9GAMM|nr:MULTISPECIES: TonB-dependent receptor [Pseudoalteromonas]OHU87659.1 TonB-dependent receptor [Pseudoalteromonas sp. JW3]OHU91101.1 TonB-dependent receptor [Pseudoalteromonas amylolytica]
MSTKTFQRSVLASTIAVALSSGIAHHANAQDSATVQEDIEIIQVKGIRASTVKSINVKRFAASQVDGIASEDIGKLPDVTISDSLQRITGVQVERTAGESGPVQIRGMGQVDTTLNGEVFLSATTIDSSGANFGDLPAQLFSGVDVYKTSQTKRTASGITGSVDLKTRRPFNMDEGWVYNVSADVTQGSISEQSDPTLTGLISYNTAKWGVLFSAATQEATLATDYNGYFDTSENGGIGAANNNFTWGQNPRGEEVRHVVPQGFAAFNKQEKREREGYQFAFQADLSEGFELVFEAFYTDQSRFNDRRGLSQNNRWYTFNDYAYPTESGWTGDTFTDADGNPWGAVNDFYLKPWRLQTFTQVNNNFEKSTNLNLELNFNNGGALTGQVRATRAHASARMRHGYGEGDMLSIDRGTLVTGPGQLTPAEFCGDDDTIVGDQGGCYAAFSPGGIEDDSFLLRYNASGESPVFSGFEQIVNGGQGSMSIADYMGSIDSYHIGAFSSEGNTDDEGEINTFSTKWNYQFDDVTFITSVDFGIRMMEREVDHDQFTYTSEFGNGCDVAQWKAVDQYHTPATCEGNPAAGEYLTQDVGDIPAGTWVPYTLLNPARLDTYTTVSQISSYGSVQGIPAMWSIDPNNFRDPYQFHLDTFGNVQRIENAGASYDVELNEFSYFLQANFEYNMFKGNFGMKVVETDLYVKQNLAGANLPHSGLGPDVGDVVTERNYTDYLPSINITADVTEDVIVRAAYSKNMQALTLSNWGGGKTVGKAINGDCDCLRVVNGTLSGNPELNPWRSKNFSLSAERYSGQASMAFLALYKIDIESFTTDGTVMIDEPDDDGIRRGPWPFTTQVQGEGGYVKGVEIGMKAAFGDYTDISILQNFGVDVNYTFSDSGYDTNESVFGELPFPGNSEDTYNFVLWYEQDEFSTRLAWNSRSPRLVTTGSSAVGGQSLYQDDYSQLDFSATYHATEYLDIFLHGSNITEEVQQTYLQFAAQKAFRNEYESRWTLGVRATF